MSTDAGDAVVAEVLRLHHEGASIRRIAKKLKLARMTVRAFLGAPPAAGRPRALEYRHDGVGEVIMLSAEEETQLLLLGLSSELGLGYLVEIVTEVMVARAMRAGGDRARARRRHRRGRSR